MEEALVDGCFDDGIAWPRTRSPFNVIGCCRCVRFIWTDMTLSEIGRRLEAIYKDDVPMF